MKDKILLINYYWPPCGGPAVQRWLDITRFLAEKGIASVVVTIDESVATFPTTDQTLRERIHPSTRVYTTGTSELFHIYKKYFGKGKVPDTAFADEQSPGFLQKLGRFARGNFFLPDPRRGWNKHALAMAAKLIAEEGIRMVFTAGPPHSSHLVGLALKRRFPQLCWIADFHDYWTDISYLDMFYRTALAARIDRRLEQKVLNRADAVMTHCRSSQRLLAARISQGDPGKVFVHTMGFNEALFPPPAPQRQERFIVTYTGMIAANYQPAAFFEAVSQACAAMPEVPLLLRFAGRFGDGLAGLARACGLGDRLELTGYVAHNQAIAYLREASALFIANPVYRNEKIVIPGKLYEYLAAFKPVISIGPADSETAEILAAMHAGRNFRRDDVAGIRDYLCTLMRLWQQQGHADLPYRAEVERNYGRRSEAFSLADRIRSMIH